MALKLYPIGIQTFERIRKDDRLYVDKTEYVYRMTHNNYTYVFLGRPRRFGKSLLVSTLESYFEGRKELFEGLAIEKLEKEWKEYPVLHFDLSGGKHQDEEQLYRYLNSVLRENERKYGFNNDETIDINIRLDNLIQRVFEITGKQMVVLIDEYDAPLLDVAHQDEKIGNLRNIMRNFFSPLKKNESIYAGICGITKEELLTQMSEDIDALAKRLSLSREATIQKLKDNYDGYHFAWPSPDVFNPYSLLNCLADGKLKAYWFGSGTPTFLIEMMRKFRTVPSKIAGMQAKESSFDAPTENMKSIIPLLYQSGYVTIKDYDPLLELYTLDFPNREIRMGLYDSLLANGLIKPEETLRNG